VDAVLEIVVKCIPRLLEDQAPAIRTSAAQCVCMVLHRYVTPELARTMEALHREHMRTTSQAIYETVDAAATSSGVVLSTVKRPELLGAFTQVLDRVIMVGVADSHAEIRHAVFSSLTPPSDPFVLRTKSLGLVYQALNDESFLVREAVTTVVARLAHLAPLSVMPIVRKCLGQQMEQLECVRCVAASLYRKLSHSAGIRTT
jgi:hypothetical protein